ncbi:MAG: ABC transporter permease subunit [Clostridiales bacterium]|nr:sugar ABC transporter permease [Clostridiales bacterium]MDU3243735.1 ABC transporter permease subunit [Clostridiales bacterium]
MKEKRNRGRVSRRKNTTLTIMALPAAVILFLFSYVPIAGLIIAFKDFRYDRGFLGSGWIGFKNFEFFFKSNDAWVVLRNTIGLNVLFIGITLVVSVGIALMMNEVRSRKMIKVTQTIMFFPFFMSWVVVGYLLYAYLHHDYGIINQLLQFFGLHSISWYARSEYWPVILTFMYAWKMAGYYSVIYYAGLMGIDDTYYEAAALDGASRWQMVWKITLPMLKGIIIVMVILQVGRIMYADFGLFFNLTRDQGALYATTDVLDTYIYRALRVTGDIGIGSAVGCFQAVIGFLLIMGSNLVVRKLDKDSALF